jgi:hypothetical protein
MLACPARTRKSTVRRFVGSERRDEPHIAREREALEAGLRLAALREHRKATGPSSPNGARRLPVEHLPVRARRGPATHDHRRVDRWLGGRLKMVAVFDDETIDI